MEIKTEQIEEIFRKADFSKESALKLSLSRKLFPVRKVNLNTLMEEEGMKANKVEKDSRSKQRSTSMQAEKGRKRHESLGAVERENPLIKKNKPPVI